MLEALIKDLRSRAFVILGTREALKDDGIDDDMFFTFLETFLEKLDCSYSFEIIHSHVQRTQYYDYIGRQRIVSRCA